MRTSLYISSTLLSEKITKIKPRQHSISVRHQLLDGTWHVQTIGDPARSWEIVCIIPETLRETIDSYAARKDILTLHRHGEEHAGIIDTDPDWEQIVGSTDPTQAQYRCSLVLLEVTA